MQRMGAGLSPHASAAALPAVRPLCARVEHTCTHMLTHRLCPSLMLGNARGLERNQTRACQWRTQVGLPRLPRGRAGARRLQRGEGGLAGSMEGVLKPA